MKEYYDRRAPEYDDWYLGAGAYAARQRPGWEAELDAVRAVLRALPAARTLDVACGTGYLTRELAGQVVALDQSEAMLAVAACQAPRARLVRGDALALPFDDDAFDRVVTGHFYGHLEEQERTTFLTEARRVAAELVVVDSALREDVEPAEWQERRVYHDGTVHHVFKRYFSPVELVTELGGEPLHAGRWFVVVRSTR